MTQAPTTAIEALRHAETALRRTPDDPRLLLQRAQCLLALGHTTRACEAADAARLRASADASVLDAIGNLFSRASDQTRALAAFEQAIALAPNEPHFAFNRATVRRFLGDLEGAERDYDRVIRQKPEDYEAYLNRSELREQSRDRNHIGELEARLARGVTSWHGEVALRYALAKEYEDLGQYDRSFEYLTGGARVRREHLRYDVGIDVGTAEWIMEAYPHALLPEPVAMVPSVDLESAKCAPIFIVGMPRSGSTLVERILGSHSAVRAAGELPHFALAVVAAVAGEGPGAISRRDLVRQSALVDFGRLGTDYLSRVRAAGVNAARFTDKMPLNYLYCGLIRRALPHARIVHVRRGSMAACYAMFKTLFKDGYPFSYDLEELGRYYVAYRGLMQHWQATLPGCIYELSYEALVADQRGETQRLLEFCGLEWQEDCMQFHSNAMATTTASAVQVRRPLYGTAVAQWRNYARQLEPLRQQLIVAGINVEE